jgi:hypothetical protein
VLTRAPVLVAIVKIPRPKSTKASLVNASAIVSPHPLLISDYGKIVQTAGTKYQWGWRSDHGATLGSHGSQTFEGYGQGLIRDHKSGLSGCLPTDG